MKIIPAIDIIDGKCVRLTQGDYGQKTLLGMDPPAHDLLDQASRCRPGLLGPVHEADGGPFRLGLMRLGHVLGLGRVLPPHVAAQVRGDASAAQEDFDGRLGCAQVELLADEQVRHAVEVAIELDVVVDLHAGTGPPREFVDARREGFERGAFELFEELPSRLLERAHRAVIQFLEEGLHRLA